MRRVMWIEDKSCGLSYNMFCAFEVALINLMVISEDEQIGMDELDTYIEELDELRDSKQNP